MHVEYGFSSMGELLGMESKEMGMESKEKTMLH